MTLRVPALPAGDRAGPRAGWAPRAWDTGP